MKTAPRKFLTISLILHFLFVSPPIGIAVENGDLADGNDYVVPISVQVGASTWQSCSGAVLAPLVIATAGHCVLDQTGLLSTQILVGNPGSSNSPTTSWAKATKIYVSDEYKGSAADGTVSASDVAFLLLDRAIGTTKQIYLASENELQSQRNSAARLRIIGYGYTSDSGARSTSPYGFDATFSKQIATDPNQAIAVSTKANVCKGDSGGPILNVSPSRVTLVGVITGTYPSNFCTRKQPDGTYWTAFTAINRFSNLAAEAIKDSLKVEQAQNSAVNKSAASENESLNSRISELELENATITDELEKAKEELDKAKKINAAFKLSGLRAITCSNLVITKIVVGKAPQCPKGYKKE